MTRRILVLLAILSLSSLVGVAAPQGAPEGSPAFRSGLSSAYGPASVHPALPGAAHPVPAPSLPVAPLEFVAGTSGTPVPALESGVSSTMTGLATWYAASGDIAAAPWWRWGDDPEWATVSYFHEGQTLSVTVLVQDHCQCFVGTPDERAIDLSDDAFRQLAPLGVGRIRVTIEIPGQGPRVTLPPTDTGGDR